MKKKQEKEQQVIYELNDFENHCHLWNIIVGGSGKGLVLLRKIVDAIQSDSNPGKDPPSILLVGKSGTGKKLVSRAIANSLICEDVRTCPGEYFHDNIPSLQFFQDSFPTTIHIIYDIENISKMGESVLWKYLKRQECKYYNYTTRSYDWIVHCNGMIIMTTKDKDKLSKAIVDNVDYIVELEPYTTEQLKIIVHQQLKFCSIDYGENEEILKEIVEQGYKNIGITIDFLKICLMLLKAEMLDCLTMEVVEKATRMSWGDVFPPAVPKDDGIPF